VKYPLDILKDVFINEVPFYVPVDFVILYMAEDAYIKIIFRGSFLTIISIRLILRMGGSLLM